MQLSICACSVGLVVFQLFSNFDKRKPSKNSLLKCKTNLEKNDELIKNLEFKYKLFKQKQMTKKTENNTDDE